MLTDEKELGLLRQPQLFVRKFIAVYASTFL